MAGREAVRRLLELGYSKVRDYRGGIADWKANNGSVVSSAAQTIDDELESDVASPIVEVSRRTVAVRRHQWGNAVLDLIERRSTGELFLFWLATILACGTLYWLATLLDRHGLVE